MSLIAIIPARGNSKRLPNKNLLPCNGVPLVVRAIRVAKESGLFGERIFVSSEDERILKIADKEGAHPFSRVPILSDDNIQTASVVIDVLARTYYSCDSFCVLNPTSPLRTAETLKHLADVFQHPLPWDCLMTGIWGLGEAPIPPTWVHDGTAIFCKTKPFLAALDFYKLTVRWVNYDVCRLDINTAEDFARAEKLLKERESK